MELKIKDRDYVADGMGGLVRVSGWDELLERVLFKLSVRRGSFSLLPAFDAEWNAPLPIIADPTASVDNFIPDYYPRPIPRLVSCYALFK